MGTTLGQLVAAIGGDLRLGDGGLASRACRGELRVAMHSARIRPGEVFWALPGARFEGADFAEEAFRRGATGVVTQRPGLVPPPGCFVLTVGDALAALWRLGQWYRTRFTGPVVAVTGSHGKTTTREMIARALSPGYRTAVSPKNYNNHVGLPLSLLELSADAQAAVLELAASAPGEIDKLAKLADPQVGVITGVGEAHLAGFGDIDATCRAKCELLAALPSSGLAVLNGDYPLLRKAAIVCAAPIVWYGRSPACDLRAQQVRWSNGELSFQVAGVSFAMQVWGRHHLNNALAAIAVGRHLGLELAEMAHALGSFVIPVMRGRVTRAGGLWVLDDTYNASPSAMRALLDLLGELPARGRRLLVCGDMLDLGPATEAWHATIGRETVTRGGVDRLICIGQQAATTAAAAAAAGMGAQQIAVCRTVDDAYRAVTGDLQRGDWIAVKGSRALGLEALVARLCAAAREMPVPRQDMPAEVIPLSSIRRRAAAAA